MIPLGEHRLRDGALRAFLTEKYQCDEAATTKVAEYALTAIESYILDGPVADARDQQRTKADLERNLNALRHVRRLINRSRGSRADPDDWLSEPSRQRVEAARELLDELEAIQRGLLRMEDTPLKAISSDKPAEKILAKMLFHVFQEATGKASKSNRAIQFIRAALEDYFEPDSIISESQIKRRLNGK